MDSHGFGLDGIRIRGGAFWSFFARTPGRPTHAVGAVIRFLAMVRDGANRRWSNHECFCRMAPRQIGPGIGSRRYGTRWFLEAGCRDCFLPGIVWAGNGDLFGFGPKFHSLAIG